MKQSIGMLKAELITAKRNFATYAERHGDAVKEVTKLAGWMSDAQAKIDDLEAALTLLEVNQGLVERSGKTS